MGERTPAAGTFATPRLRGLRARHDPRLAGWIAAAPRGEHRHSHAEETEMLTTSPFTDLSAQMAGRVVTASDPDWDAARQVFNLALDLRPAAVALPRDESDVVGRRRATPARTDCGSRRRRPATTRARIGVARRRPADRRPRAPGGLDRPRRPARAGRARASSGSGSRRRCRSTGWPPCTARRPTSASPATRSAAAWAGSPASTASRRTASRRSSWSRRTGARPRGRRARARPVLGAARRQRELRRGHRDRVRGVPRRGAVRGRDVLPLRARGRGAARLDRAGPTLPDEMMTWASLLQFPDAPFVPEAVRGGSFAVVYGAFLGERARGPRAPAPRARARARRWTRSRWSRRLCSATWRWTRPTRCRSSSATALLERSAARGRGRPRRRGGPGLRAPLAMVQLRHMGGALGARRRRAPARAQRCRATFCLFALGVPEDERSAAANAAYLERSSAPSRPTAPATTPTSSRSPPTRARFFDAETWARLRRGQGAVRPRRPVPRQPPHPARRVS